MIMESKKLQVVAAIICKDNRIFATQRGYGKFKGQWEFPGGKVEPGETPEEALVQEIKEELDTEIAVAKYIHTVEYDYPTFHLSMRCYLCKIVVGKLVLKHIATFCVKLSAKLKVRFIKFLRVFFVSIGLLIFFYDFCNGAHITVCIV